MTMNLTSLCSLWSWLAVVSPPLSVQSFFLTLPHSRKNNSAVADKCISSLLPSLLFLFLSFYLPLYIFPCITLFILLHLYFYIQPFWLYFFLTLFFLPLSILPFSIPPSLSLFHSFLLASQTRAHCSLFQTEGSSLSRFSSPSEEELAWQRLELQAE